LKAHPWRWVIWRLLQIVLDCREKRYRTNTIFLVCISLEGEYTTEVFSTILMKQFKWCISVLICCYVCSSSILLHASAMQVFSTMIMDYLHMLII
jgi:hypothetical protein